MGTRRLLLYSNTFLSTLGSKLLLYIQYMLSLHIFLSYCVSPHYLACSVCAIYCGTVSKISVAAIKIAQKIIINIVGYRKKFQIYIYYTLYIVYFAFHTPKTSADFVRCWVRDDICMFAYKQEWEFVRYMRVFTCYIRLFCR